MIVLLAFGRVKELFLPRFPRAIPPPAANCSRRPTSRRHQQERRTRCGACGEDAKQKLECDLDYGKNHSLFLDFMITLNTVEVVLFGKGAR